MQVYYYSVPTRRPYPIECITLWAIIQKDKLERRSLQLRRHPLLNLHPGNATDTNSPSPLHAPSQLCRSLTGAYPGRYLLKFAGRRRAPTDILSYFGSLTHRSYGHYHQLSI